MPNPTDFVGNFMFLNLAQRYNPALTAEELYQAARQAWPMAACRQKLAKFVAVVREGEIKEVYEVQKWEPCVLPGLTGRFEFIGTPIIGKSREAYIGKSAAPYMPRGAVFVISYNFKC